MISTGLDWYRDQANHGRGRIGKATEALLRAGYLHLAWTSMYCWVITLTPKGKAALDAQGGTARAV